MKDALFSSGAKGQSTAVSVTSSKSSRIDSRFEPGCLGGEVAPYSFTQHQ